MIHFEKRHSKIQLLCLTGTNFRFFKDPLSMDYKNDCELVLVSSIVLMILYPAKGIDKM